MYLNKYSVVCMYKYVFSTFFHSCLISRYLFWKLDFSLQFSMALKFFFIENQSSVSLLKTLDVTVATESYSDHLPDEYSKDFMAFSFIVSNSTYWHALSIVFSKYCFHPPSFTCISQVSSNFLHLVVLAFHSLVLFTLSIFIPAHSSSSSMNIQVKFSWTQIISFFTLNQ